MGVPSDFKVCPRCTIEQPATFEFFSARYAKGRRLETLDSWCRACRRATYRQHHQTHRQARADHHRAARLALRLRALTHYGTTPPRCACCGEGEMMFLVLDHVNGGGHKQRVAVNKRGISFYAWLEKQGWPDGYRVLCHNCNAALGLYGFCSHQGPQGGANHGAGHAA